MKSKSVFLALLLVIFSIGSQLNFKKAGLVTNIDDFNSVNNYRSSKHNFVQGNNEAFKESTFIEEHVSCLDSEKTINSTIEVFHFTSNSKIDTVSSIGNIKLLNFIIEEEKIICSLSNFLLDENINLQFYNENILVDYITLYFATDNCGTFYSSSLSLDTAKKNAGQTLSYQLIDDIEDAFDDNKEHNAGISLLGIGVTGSVSGTFCWTDDEGKIHPLIGAKIKITICGSWWYSISYTNQTGFYSFSYSDIWYVGSGKPIITIYADNDESINVSNDGIYAKSQEMSGSSGNFTCSYTFSPIVDGDIGKAMIIFQAAKNFADYAEVMNGGNPVTSCTFEYPGDPTNGCYYSNNVVTITSKQRKDTSFPNPYSSWDVIGHEYGHHIQSCYGISASPGGVHAISSNIIDYQYDTKNGYELTRKYTLEQSKDRGLKLAWGEGRPTYWSTMAQSTFLDDLKTIFTVGDTFYTSYNGINYNLNSYSTPYFDGSFGDADEVAIQQILYKLSSNVTDQIDKFSISVNTLRNIIIENKPHTLYEFINDLYDDGYNRYDLGILLSKFHVAVNNLTISNNFLDECPTFTWSTYMGSSYLYYNNFDLVFLSPSGNEILRKDNITTTGKMGQYTLTKNEWSNIISLYEKTYYAFIVSRQTLSFTSGNYYSELFKFTIPDDFNRKVQIKPNEWGFEPQYYFEYNKEGHTSSIITDHGLTITTNRLRCGYIENSYVVLSPKRQNAGTAFLELYFDSPVYSYMFGICLWSNNEGLSNSNCTAIIEAMDANGNWYVDWDLFSDLPNGFSIKTQQIDRYHTACKDGIYGIRFMMNSPATGDRNKGRLCLDDIILNTDPNDSFFI